MVYPALTDLATFLLVIGVGIPSTYLFAWALKLHPQKPTFPNKKKMATLSLIVFVATFMGAFGIYGFYDRIWVRTTLTADPLYVVRDVIAIAIILLPTSLALQLSKQKLIDVAITRNNLGKSLALGSLTSMLLIAVLGATSPLLGGGFAGFSGATVFLLLSYIIIAFGEEIVFRGYIQTRLVNFGGSAAGIVASSLLYATYNFALGYYCFGGDIFLAAIYGAWRFSSGLVYGYVFHSTQNIASSIIVHIFIVWGGLLFSLYL